MPSFSHLVVGLGNPEPDYAGTRHNIGFMIADALALRYRLSNWKKQFKALVAGNDRLFLMKPQTFMNLSGESIGEAMRFFQTAPSEVIVFHDDLDLLPGQVKIKRGGGAGGHNGLKSLDTHIGPDYWRVRIGIGHPGVKGDAVTHYVLGRFAKADQTWTGPLLDALAQNFDMMLDGRVADYVKAVRIGGEN